MEVDSKGTNQIKECKRRDEDNDEGHMNEISMQGSIGDQEIETPLELNAKFWKYSAQSANFKEAIRFEDYKKLVKGHTQEESSSRATQIPPPRRDGTSDQGFDGRRKLTARMSTKPMAVMKGKRLAPTDDLQPFIDKR